MSVQRNPRGRERRAQGGHIQEQLLGAHVMSKTGFWRFATVGLVGEHRAGLLQAPRMGFQDLSGPGSFLPWSLIFPNLFLHLRLHLYSPSGLPAFAISYPGAFLRTLPS